MVRDRQNLDYLYDIVAEYDKAAEAAERDAGGDRSPQSPGGDRPEYPKYLDIASRALRIDKDILSVENLGQDLNRRIWDSGLFTSEPESDFWREFKKEFRRFICTKDPKYRALWTKLERTAGKSEMVIVSTIAAAVAASSGLAPAALVPFCAVGLIAVLKVGKEAFCKSIGEPPP